MTVFYKYERTTQHMNIRMYGRDRRNRNGSKYKNEIMNNKFCQNSNRPKNKGKDQIEHH